MDDDVVRAKRAMMASGARKCLLINHLRFGRSAPHVLAGLDDSMRSSLTTPARRPPRRPRRNFLTVAGHQLTAQFWIGTSWKMNKTWPRRRPAEALAKADGGRDSRISAVIPPFTAVRE